MIKYYIKLNLFLLILFIILFPYRLFAETQVSGTISEDTNWDISGSPYILAGSLQIAAGATLTIEPGVTVEQNSSSSRYIRIYGTLNAQNVSFIRTGPSAGNYPISVYEFGALNATGCDFTDNSTNLNYSINVSVYSGGSCQLSSCVFSTVRNEPHVDFRAGSSGSVANCIGDWELETGASGISITGNTVSHIEFSGGNPTVTGNTIASSTPLVITDPDTDFSGVAGASGSWSTPTAVLTEVASEDIDNLSMAIDGSNNWHLVYQHPDGGINYLNSNSDQDTLFANSGYTPSIDMDSNGAAHVMLVDVEWVDPNFVNQVLYMNNNE